MSDYTNPPAGGHYPGASSGPQGPYGGPPLGPPVQHNPYAGHPGPPYSGQPYQPVNQNQPGPQSPYAGQPGGPGQQPHPGHYLPPSPNPSYGQSGPGVQQGPGALWPQPGQPGSPGQPPYGGPPPGFPHAQQWQPEPRRRGKLVPLIAVLAVLMVVGAGGMFAYARLIGGGDQPAAVLPGNAVAYARVDLNPSAGQRVAALRFLMKFPSAKEQIGLTSDKDDLRLKLFELIKKDSGGGLAAVDFDKDIKPWLGDRAGVVAVPGKDSAQPDVVVAVQVKDKDKARAGLDKLFADDQHKPGRAFRNGYVVLADDQATVSAAVAAGKRNSLQDNPKFKADMSALGEQGFASFWADTKGLAQLSGQKLTDEQRAVLPEGSAAVALRFDSQYVELKGIVHGNKSVKAAKGNAGDVVATLPDSTVGALAISDGETLVDTIWTQLEKASGSTGLNLNDLTKNFSDQYGISLPGDLKPLLGRNLAIAVDKEQAGGGPKIAARIETDPGRAEQVVDKVTALIRSRTSVNVPIEKAKDADTLVVATDKAYAEQVLKGGNLGQTENFKQAVPDLKGAVMVGYVDFEAAGSLTDEFTKNKDLAALRSAGYVVRVTGQGEADFTLRVVAK